MIKMKYVMMLLASLLIGAACSDDDEVKVSPYMGSYTLSKAMVAESFHIMTTADAPYNQIPVPANTDITAAVKTALLSAAGCGVVDTYIELRDNQSMYLSCESENDLNAGTWEEVSATEIKLNMNNAAIPSSPSGFVLTVKNVAINGDKLQGTTSVPMPKEMFAALLPQGITIADTPAVYLVTFTIELTKK